MAPDPSTQPAAAPFASSHLLDLLRRGIAESDLLTSCRHMNAAAAVVMLLVGVIYLLWGFYAFKALVLANAAVAGAWLGYLIGDRSGQGLPAALVAGFLAAAVTWPLMKYAVAVTGGLIGLLIGMTLWRTSGLDPAFAASGGGMGLIFFGMLSFVLFRTSVMMFTSLQGAMMVTFGLLSLVYRTHCFDARTIDAKLLVTPLAVPVAVGLATIVGMLYQNSDTGEPVAAPAK